MDSVESAELPGYERFTERARRVLALAETKARVLNHNYIGTEHILLGLTLEGNAKGAAARLLVSLGISPETLRQQVEEIIGQGPDRRPDARIPFTPRARLAVALARSEAAQQLGCTNVGSEHLLLGLIGEGEGVPSQVLARQGANLNRVRRLVMQLSVEKRQADDAGTEPDEFGESLPGEPRRGRVPSGVPVVVAALESRLSAIEQRVGSGPETADLDAQIAQARREKESAIDAQNFQQAGSLRSRERQLIAAKTARQQQWEAAHPDLASLAEQVQRVSSEVERLRDLLRRHGIEPENGGGEMPADPPTDC